MILFHFIFVASKKRSNYTVKASIIVVFQDHWLLHTTEMFEELIHRLKMNSTYFNKRAFVYIEIINIYVFIKKYRYNLMFCIPVFNYNYLFERFPSFSHHGMIETDIRSEWDWTNWSLRQIVTNKSDAVTMTSQYNRKSAQLNIGVRIKHQRKSYSPWLEIKVLNICGLWSWWWLISAISLFRYFAPK